MDRPFRSQRFEPDGAEGGLVLRQVLVEDIGQSLGLLRAQVDTLEDLDADVAGLGLILPAEGQEKIPQVHAHLNAVGIPLAIVGRPDDLDLGRMGLKRRLAHRLAIIVAHWRTAGC